MRFFFFCGLYLTLFSYCRKCKWVFLEKIPVLETQDTNGNLVRKCRTKEHCCWHIERLLARNATLITDSAKCYGPIGNAWRPDITALDCNHSVGFAAPGPKSLQLGFEEGEVSSNLVEGVQNGLYKLGRQFLGYKIGSGTDVPEGRVKDFLVFTMNMNLNDRDVLQELFLVLFFLHFRLDTSDTPWDVKDVPRIRFPWAREIESDPVLYQSGEAPVLFVRPVEAMRCLLDDFAQGVLSPH